MRLSRNWEKGKKNDQICHHYDGQNSNNAKISWVKQSNIRLNYLQATTLDLLLLPFPILDALIGADVADFEGDVGVEGAAVHVFEGLVAQEDEAVVDDPLQHHPENSQHFSRSVLTLLS